MLKFNQLFFFITTISGTLITVSAYSWFSMWIGLEINLLSIIPLLKNLNSKYPSESAFKYFIVQAMASTILLVMLILNMNLTEQINHFANNSISLILYISVLIKLGAAPFHAWFPEVLEGLSWLNCLMMMTWQKIAPMVILMQNLKMFLFLILIIISSSMIGGLMGLNQMSLRKIMAYSSINHIAWMISSMISSKMIWLIYFSIYTLISVVIILTLKSSSVYFLHQMNFFKKNKILSLSLNLNFLSLGGLPPFTGFFPKWLTINLMLNSQEYLLTFILMSLTLISLFIYTRILFSTLTMLSLSPSILSNSENKFILTFWNLFILLSLAICPMILNTT